MSLPELIIVIPVFLIAITFHEYSHGKVAQYLGDPTAAQMGRLTFNPLAHVDIFGTVILPLFLILSGFYPFGYAKPVPVNPYHFSNRRRGMMYVGLAGPGANFAVAAAASLIYRSGFISPETAIGLFLQYLIVINLLLGVFNLTPIPPLDGSRVLAGLLPPAAASAYESLERYGIILLFVFIFFFWSIFRTILSFILNPLYALFLGHGF